MASEKQFSTRSMAEVTKKLYLNEETADVHFVFKVDDDEQRVAAHKNILALGSPVFHSMFYGTLKEKGDVKITDSSANGFMEFLSIFYLEEVKITNANISEFMYLANKYNINEGMDICEEYLLTNTNTSELCTHYGLALRYNLNKLRKYCESEICMHSVEVFKSNGFIGSSKDVFESILKLNDYNCFEIEIFNACMTWAENACKKNEIDTTDKQNLRLQLGESFYLIPFTTMMIDNFSKVFFANRTLFTLDEVADIMAFITAGEITELSKKFTKNRSIVKIFKWDEDYLIKCTRDSEEGGTLISRDEYTTFTASKKMLLGGFHLFDIKNTTDSGKNLSGTVCVSRESDTDIELQEKVEFVLYADKKSSAPLEIKLKTPIIITPNVKYNIHVDFSGNEMTEDNLIEGWEYSGKPFISTTASIVDEDIFIEFHAHSESEHGTEFSIVSQLYFNRL